ncbi:YidC/Oxa1 family insertase periplasmic domain-containing protein, partial [Acinetobacter baumannii]
TDAWLGITDKYWAAALLPDAHQTLMQTHFLSLNDQRKRYQVDYLLPAQTINIGGTGTANTRVFAGAKEVSVVGINFPLVGFGGYNLQL